jgi:hypothetical protein
MELLLSCKVAIISLLHYYKEYSDYNVGFQGVWSRDYNSAVRDSIAF